MAGGWRRKEDGTTCLTRFGRLRRLNDRALVMSTLTDRWGNWRLAAEALELEEGQLRAFARRVDRDLPTLKPSLAEHARAVRVPPDGRAA